jgi:uncharacterized protein
MPQAHLIGVISDTHGLLRPEAVQALQGSELIIHGGDIGKPEILDGLRKIAPIAAIRGNVDHGIWAQGLPQTRTVVIGEVRVFVIHNINDLSIHAAAVGSAAVISGHSHRPSAVQKNGVVFLNPGSAGPRRFDLPVSVAVLRAMGKAVKAQIVELRGSKPNLFAVFLGIRHVFGRSSQIGPQENASAWHELSQVGTGG